MRVLAVDTSSDRGSIAIAVDGEVAAEVRFQASIQYSERLFRSIDFLLSNIGASVEEVDVFAAARGPGSFTGLRVGLSAIQGFAFATGKKATGISTLSALAWQVEPGERLVGPMMDARRGEIYGALYRRTQEELVAVIPPGVLQPAEWLESLPSGRVVLCGPGAEKNRRVIETLGEYSVVAVDPYLAPTIAMMATVGHEELLEPLYLRPSNARRLFPELSVE